jgi:phosphoheptose isomerase
VASGNLRDAIATFKQAASLESEMIAAADAISKALLSGKKLMACTQAQNIAQFAEFMKMRYYIHYQYFADTSCLEIARGSKHFPR